MTKPKGAPSVRVTIVIPKSTMTKLRAKQSQAIKETQKSISFSKTVAEYCEKGMKS